MTSKARTLDHGLGAHGYAHLHWQALLFSHMVFGS